MTSRGSTILITQINTRGVYYKDTRDGKPIGFHDKHMKKDEFERWANHQKKYAKSFEGGKIEWTKYRDFQFLQTQEMNL